MPFFISDPRHDQVKTSDAVVSLLDLFPTLCRIADIPIPDDLEGESLDALLKGESKQWRNEAFSELWSFYHGGRGSYMLRKDHMKYIHYYHKDYPDQLFDLEQDPNECNDLANESDYHKILGELSRLGMDKMPYIT